jgi:hypothetical protein
MFINNLLNKLSYDQSTVDKSFPLFTDTAKRHFEFFGV